MLALLKKFFSKLVPHKSVPIEEPLDSPKKQYEFHRLSVDESGYFLNSKRIYKPDGILKKETIDLVFNFAYGMTQGNAGEHRDHRSGGSHMRKAGEIFANTFQGKLSECAACNFFWKYDKSIYPDFKQYKLGQWDTVDLTVQGKEIAVKSTKYYGELLLMETKDWDKDGRYIPNADKNKSLYDCFMLVRIKPNCEDIMKANRMLYTSVLNKDQLYRIISGQKWEYNFAGFITLDEYKYLINNDYILPKGAKLNRKTVMDAENYYIQSGDMHDMNCFEEMYL